MKVGSKGDKEFHEETIFIKRYFRNYKTEWVKSQFDRANRVYDILKDTSYGTPKPIYYLGNEIAFEKLDIIPISDYNPLLKDMGRILGIIHKNADIIIGDVALTNFMQTKDKLMIIDFEVWGGEQSYCGDCYKDIAQLISTLDRTPFLKKKIISSEIAESLILEGHKETYGSQDLDKYYKVKKDHYFSLKSGNVVRKIFDKRLKNDISRVSDYRQRYENENTAKGYDKMYDFDNHYSIVWNTLEKDVLKKALSHAKKGKLLDFACGTGRVTREIKGLFNECKGIDISPEMVRIAKVKDKSTDYMVGDITQEPIPVIFDCITAYRFFLHADPILRIKALSSLSKMMDKDSVLIFNVHGSKPSLLTFYNLKNPLNLLSSSDIKNLLSMTDLKIKKSYGYATIPPRITKIIGKKAYKLLDSIISSFNIFPMFRTYIAIKG